VAELVRDAVVLGSVYTLFALGLTLSWGVLNVLNLAHGSVLVFVALICYLLTTSVALPLWTLLIVGVVVGGLLGVLLEVLVFRPIRRRSSDSDSAAMAILIASVAVGALLFEISDRITGGRVRSINPGSFTVEVYQWGSLAVSNIQIIIVVIALVLSFGIAVFINRTRTGKALRAIAFDRQTSSLLGISSERLAIGTMAVSGALAGLAGVLLAFYLGSVEASMTQSLLLKAFAILIIGGVGNVYGAIAGAFLISFAEVLTVNFLSSGLRDAVAFVVVLLLLLLRPQGLFGAKAWQRA
jgi:branched-chain amino acid transport system permease protein